MRFFCVLPALGLFLRARASSLDSRGPASHPLDVRATPDTCASLHTSLVVPDLLGILTAVGLIGVFILHSISIHASVLIPK